MSLKTFRLRILFSILYKGVRYFWNIVYTAVKFLAQVLSKTCFLNYLQGNKNKLTSVQSVNFLPTMQNTGASKECLRSHEHEMMRHSLLAHVVCILFFSPSKTENGNFFVHSGTNTVCTERRDFIHCITKAV